MYDYEGIIHDLNRDKLENMYKNGIKINDKFIYNKGFISMNINVTVKK